MKCPKCGFKNPKNARYCGNCQWELPEKQKRNPSWLLLGVVALLVIVLIINLFSGPSIEEIEAQIDAIGMVTINSEAQLNEIVDMCKQLSPEKQMQIRNLDVLVKASEEYARQAEVIADAMNAINNMGEITLDSKDAVASARKKYDQAKEYDLNHIMKGHLVLLEAAEEELNVLIKEQEQSLEYALSGIGNVTSLFFTGDYSRGESSFQTQIDKLKNNNDRQQYADAVMEQICEWAQTSYDKGSYINAVTVLQHSDVVKAKCSKEMSAKGEELAESFAAELNSKAPKNGEVLARTFSKGANSFTITVGPADTCVKIESVNEPEKYAVMYIRANEKATLYNIKSDEYSIKYTTGPVWYGEEALFGPDATYILWTETIKPEADTSGGYRTWTQYTWTIEYGYSSDYGVQNMEPSDF